MIAQTLTTLTAIILLLGALKAGTTIETNALRVDTLKRQLQDTQFEVKADLTLPAKAEKEIRGQLYTEHEYDQIKKNIAAKTRNFKNEEKTTNEEIAIIFDLLNQCGGVEKINDDMNTEIGDRLEQC